MKKFTIVLALLVVSIVFCAGCIDPQEPVNPVVPVDPIDPITPVEPVEPELPVEEYAVMFMLNYDDAGAYTAETVKAGDTVSKPATPTRSGYTFTGWFTASDGGVVYDFTQPVNADTMLYAQWKKKSSSGGSSHYHNWGEGVVTNEATCVADGLRTYTCNCGQTRTEAIPATGHNPVEVDENGKLTIKCSENDVVYKAKLVTPADEISYHTEVMSAFENANEGDTIHLAADMDSRIAPSGAVIISAHKHKVNLSYDDDVSDIKILKENSTISELDVVNISSDGKVDIVTFTTEWNNKFLVPVIVDDDALASNSDKLDEVIKAGKETIFLKEGNYIIPDSAQGKTLTIIGNGKTVIKVQDDGSYEGCDYSLDGSTVAFKNIIINTDSSTYSGYARLKATYDNCVISGTYTLYGESIFNDSTFNIVGDYYNIWTWGAGTAKFNNCTFNTDGKSILVYNQECDVYLNNCIFNDRTGGVGFTKSAIETGVDAVGPEYNVYITNTIVNGFAENDKCVGYKNIVGNKNSMGIDKLNVVVDGVDVY